MTKRYTVCEALDHIFDHDTGEEDRGQETDSEDALEEEVSEVEDNTEYDPDQETTDVEQISTEEEGPAEVVVTCIYLLFFSFAHQYLYLHMTT